MGSSLCHHCLIKTKVQIYRSITEMRISLNKASLNQFPQLPIPTPKWGLHHNCTKPVSKKSTDASRKWRTSLHDYNFCKLILQNHKSIHHQNGTALHHNFSINQLQPSELMPRPRNGDVNRLLHHNNPIPSYKLTAPSPKWVYIYIAK